jgi:hypothetical protein
MKSSLAFFAKMSKKEKLVFGIALGFVLIAFFDRVIFAAIMSRMRTIDEETRTKQLVLKKDLKVLAQKDAILTQDKDYSVYSVQAKSEEEEISGILKEIEGLATQAGVYLGEIKPGGVKEETVMKKYTITLACEATMEQLAGFMYLIENSKTLFTIDNYSLTVKDKEKGTLKCGMTISKVVVP